MSSHVVHDRDSPEVNHYDVTLRGNVTDQLELTTVQYYPKGTGSMYFIGKYRVSFAGRTSVVGCTSVGGRTYIVRRTFVVGCMSVVGRTSVVWRTLYCRDYVCRNA